MLKYNILIAAAETGIRDLLRQALEKQYVLFLVRDAAEAREILQRETVALILADQHLPETTAIDLLEDSGELAPDAGRILIVHHPGPDLCQEAVNRGRAGYLLRKPWGQRELLQAIRAGIEQFARQQELAYQLQTYTQAYLDTKDSKERLEREADLLLDQTGEAPAAPSDLIGQSLVMQEVLELVRSSQHTDAPVLVVGEPGTGKKMVARVIHEHSGRGDQPLCVIKCSAFSPEVLERELFGHKRGAFQGATTDKDGLLKKARTGAILLDGVEALTLELQEKLMWAVRDRSILPVGAREKEEVDVRLFSTTAADLSAAIREGRFREDFLYELNATSIVLPPLRDRQEDVPLLAQHFLAGYTGTFKKALLGFTPEALRLLTHHQWPENVRELKHVIAKTVVGAQGGMIRAEDFPLEFRRGVAIQEIIEHRPDIPQRLFERLAHDGEEFREVVQEPFLRHDLTRRDLMKLIQIALSYTQGDRAAVGELFHMEGAETDQMFQFLQEYDCLDGSPAGS